MVRVRLFANLREAAGTGSLEIPGDTVEEVVGRATARFGPSFARALRTAQTWVNGERAGPATPVGDDDEIALIPPVAGGTAVVRAPAGLELATLAVLTAALFVGNALSLQWLAVALVLTGAIWGQDVAGAANRRGLGVGAVPIILAVTGSVLAAYRFGATGMAVATAGAVLLSMVWSVATPHLRPVESIAAGALLAAIGAFGAGALVVLRLRSEAEMTSFLVVVAVVVAASWATASTDLVPVDPLTAGALGAVGAGILAGAVWSEELWPTVVAAAAAAVGWVAGRNVGSLARSGGFFMSGSTLGSLVHLDGVIVAGGAFWLVLRLLA
ncbi:MAG: MoaD/ThiS family protein [Actinobacteria bacterium]|nr:MoaD/ThiS family protein [Actinomycetota bacterium]